MFPYKCTICCKYCEENHKHIAGCCWNVEVAFQIESFCLHPDDSQEFRDATKKYAHEHKYHYLFGKYNGYGEVVCKDIKGIRFFTNYFSVVRDNKDDLIFIIKPACCSCYLGGMYPDLT